MVARISLALALALAFTGAPGCDARSPATPKSTPTRTPTPAEGPSASASPEPEALENKPEETGPKYAEAAGVEYLELTTAGASPDAPLPMLVAIHGLGDRPENFAGLVRDLPVAARVILPRALDEHEEGFSWFPIRARSDDIEGLSAGLRTAADAIAGLVRELRARRPTLGRPVVTGFSQGGMLAFTLAAHHPELIAAAYPVGGWLPPPLWPTARPDRPERDPTVVALHGDSDRALLIDNTRASIAKQKQLGYAVELVEYPDVGHQITAEMRDKLHAMLGEALREQAASEPAATN